jgi:hypothetical protein
MFWITFKWRDDRLGARVDGDKATVYWNAAEPREKRLDREYTWSEMQRLTQADIQMGIMAVVGPEIMNISEVRITNEDIDWRYK